MWKIIGPYLVVRLQWNILIEICVAEHSIQLWFGLFGCRRLDCCCRLLEKAWWWLSLRRWQCENGMKMMRPHNTMYCRKERIVSFINRLMWRTDDLLLFFNQMNLIACERWQEELLANWTKHIIISNFSTTWTTIRKQTAETLRLTKYYDLTTQI